MDNLGDWLYIVLLVIAGASSLFSSGKKKKRSAAPPVPPQDDFMPEEESQSAGSFWDVFDERPAAPSRPPRPETQTGFPSPSSSSAPPSSQPLSQKKTSLFSELRKNGSRKKQQKETVPSSSVSSPFLTGERAFSDRLPDQSPVRLQPVEEEPGILPENVFSDVTEIRRAIICAEILNRKYE